MALCFYIHIYIYRVIQEESAIIWEIIICVILSKMFIWTWVRFWTVTEIWLKEDTDHPASTNSNYVINNITTNTTCMQVLTIVLLMMCNGQNPGFLTSGTSHNKISKMPPPTSKHLWTRCRILRVAHRSSWWLSFIRTQVLLMRAIRSVFHISNTWWFTLHITMHVILFVMLFIT